jgi:hypothetical protein
MISEEYGKFVKRGSSILRDLKQNWRRLKAGLPGRRFQQQFRYRQQCRSGPFRKVLFIARGILIAAADLEARENPEGLRL